MSQINTNTIANELGTGGPDFVGMPSVGGDPVVESGSNSDGEWTRWADGTQKCHDNKEVTDQSLTGSYGDNFAGQRTVTFPAPFISTPTLHGVTCRAGTGAAWASALLNLNTALEGTLGFQDVVSRSLGTSVHYAWAATGRWK